MGVFLTRRELCRTDAFCPCCIMAAWHFPRNRSDGRGTSAPDHAITVLGQGYPPHFAGLIGCSMFVGLMNAGTCIFCYTAPHCLQLQQAKSPKLYRYIQYEEKVYIQAYTMYDNSGNSRVKMKMDASQHSKIGLICPKQPRQT